MEALGWGDVRADGLAEEAAGCAEASGVAAGAGWFGFPVLGVEGDGLHGEDGGVVLEHGW